MTRERVNAPATGRPRRPRGGASGDDQSAGRSRPRGSAAQADLSDEELRALLDDNVDPDEVVRVARDADDDEQEASDHDRDTTRDRLEGLLLEQDDEF
jgi:hypothetical protein